MNSPDFHKEPCKVRAGQAAELIADSVDPKTVQINSSVSSASVFRSIAARINSRLLSLFDEVCSKSGIETRDILIASTAALLCRYSSCSRAEIHIPIGDNGRVERLSDLEWVRLRLGVSETTDFASLTHAARDVRLDVGRHLDRAPVAYSRELSENPGRLRVGVRCWQVNRAEAAAEASVDTIVAGPIPAHLDVVLYFRCSVGACDGWLSYAERRATPDAMHRFEAHFFNLMRSGLQSPLVPVVRLNYLGDEERRRVFVEWNGSPGEYPNLCLHQWIERVAQERPQRIAVESGTESLTYRDLNRRANRLAHFLRERGVRRETPVGVLFFRSIDLIVALVAVLKSGGAYVPIDASYPSERAAYVLQLLGSSLLLTHSSLLPRYDLAWLDAVCLDASSDPAAAFSDANPVAITTPDDLAYIIFTSGSTGRPKGIRVQHRGVCSLMAESQRYFGIGERCRMLQISPIGYDASVWEIFLPLVCGGTLCLAPPPNRYSLVQLPRELKERRISVAMLSPYMLSVLPPRGFPDLEVLVSIGERCTHKHASQWAAWTKFYNAYGPAEATVMVTANRITVEELEQSSQDPPIGRPLRNTRVYILDEHLQLVPVGVPGEIYIGGIHLARGYFKLSELTAETFVENPFADKDGCPLLYRTGDLAYYQDDGRICFIGRVDSQVKLRGIRLELREVESVLAELPYIRGAVAVMHKAEQREHLVVYVVSETGETPEVDKLFASLMRKLPEDLLPTAVVPLDAFPINPNGKVDRRALQDATTEEVVRNPAWQRRYASDGI